MCGREVVHQVLEFAARASEGPRNREILPSGGLSGRWSNTARVAVRVVLLYEAGILTEVDKSVIEVFTENVALGSGKDGNAERHAGHRTAAGKRDLCTANGSRPA